VGRRNFCLVSNLCTFCAFSAKVQSFIQQILRRVSNKSCGLPACSSGVSIGCLCRGLKSYQTPLKSLPKVTKIIGWLKTPIRFIIYLTICIYIYMCVQKYKCMHDRYAAGFSPSYSVLPCYPSFYHCSILICHHQMRCAIAAHYHTLVLS
jgi:hypothetical protein